MASLRASLPRAARQTRRLHTTSPALSAAESSSSKPSSKTLLPSVQHLLHEHGLSTEDAQKITPTGPSGRLLKGDVLAYIGSISKSYPSDLSKRLSTLSHLDLSNIKMAPSKAAAATAGEKAAAVVPAPEKEPVVSEIALPISLAAVVGVQKKIHHALGVQLPISTFLARATELANEDLPRSSKGSTPTADELFDAVLGLDKVKRTTTARGHFYPQIAAAASPARTPVRTAQALDILDLLAGTGRPVEGAKAVSGGESMAPSEGNVFSVSVAKGEEVRGRVFLERIKTVLEVEPGRLVL